MGERGFAHVPALDGLRAVAVGAVLAFHSGFGWASGGFLGVSLFFTLSGFLITSLLLAEHDRAGRVSLSAFYGRRARRLLPAALLCVILVVVAGAWWLPGQRAALPGDAVASTLGVANWRFVLAEASYQDLFAGGPSPLAHFWSLSIEQQCYVVLPLVVALALRGGRRAVAVVLGALWALSVAAVVATADADLVYQGTHTRAAELLAGALLAVVVARRRPAAAALPWLAGGGLFAFGAAVLLTGLDTGWLYRGGLAGAGLVWALLIAGLLGGGRVATMLALRPLVAIGRVSYGIYLFHWPVFLLLTPARLGTSGPLLHAARLGVAGALAVVSFHLVETPIRRGRTLGGWRFAALAPVLTGAVVAAALTLVPAPGYSRTEQLLAEGSSGPLVLGDTSLPTASTTPAAPAAERPVALVVGGGARPVEELKAAGFTVVHAPPSHCPIVPGDELLLPDGSVVAAAECPPAEQAWRGLRDAQVDVVVLSVADVDAAIVRFADTSGFALDDPVERSGRARRVEEGIRAAIEVLVDGDIPVVVLDTSTGGLAGQRLRKAAVRLGLELHVTTTANDAAAAARAAVVEPTAAAPVLLVLGDSTSLDMAQALHDGAEGRLRVVWAGANGCPFAEVTATRPASNVEWAPADCPDLQVVLPPLLDAHHPAAVLVMSGPTELGEHRYPGDDRAVAAGEPAFAAAHEAALAGLLALLPPGTPVVLADTPPIIPGGWASAEMADPARLAAWNAVIEGLAAGTGDSVVRWPYAAALAEYEAEHGVIRSDGVHPEVEALTDLARARLVDELLALLSIVP